ncbi:MAG: ATP-binding protein, partial [Acidobacteria bacterium]|nr:ATP-binding protein [Acidobacteriota bacterium]
MEEKTNPWNEILLVLQDKVDAKSFETWFEPTAFIGRDKDDLYVKVPNSYFKDWLLFHYSTLINESAQNLFGRVFDIKYIFDDASLTFKRGMPEERRNRYGVLLNPNLNPNYSFESFVVGSSNQFAHAAAVAVSKNPAKVYNPLYIYGGSGLGKTHLMNAIGHAALAADPGVKIVYVTTEKFMNEVITHLQFGKILDFRE